MVLFFILYLHWQLIFRTALYLYIPCLALFVGEYELLIV